MNKFELYNDFQSRLSKNETERKQKALIPLARVANRSNFSDPNPT